jgi:hypothetical protein
LFEGIFIILFLFKKKTQCWNFPMYVHEKLCKHFEMQALQQEQVWFLF